jgi:hypothetical protein
MWSETQTTIELELSTYSEKQRMIWTMELASWLDDAPFPATRDELIDYASRIGAPLQVLENLQELEDPDETYESIEDIWQDYPVDEDFFYGDEEGEDY